MLAKYFTQVYRACSRSPLGIIGSGRLVSTFACQKKVGEVSSAEYEQLLSLALLRIAARQRSLLFDIPARTHTLRASGRSSRRRGFRVSNAQHPLPRRVLALRRGGRRRLEREMNDLRSRLRLITISCTFRGCLSTWHGNSLARNHLGMYLDTCRVYSHRHDPIGSHTINESSSSSSCVLSSR